MNIVYLGSGQFGIDSLNAIADSDNKPVLIVTAPPHQAGRGRKPRPTPVAQWAEENSVSFIETEDAKKPEIVAEIAASKPDLILVIAFGQKISNKIIALPTKAAINVHASLLPKYRGAAPINWAIIKGEKQTGISIITLAEKIDAGKICQQITTDIEEAETAGLLHDRLAKLAAPLLIETIKKIDDGSVIYTEQDHTKATLAPKLKKSDGLLDFAETAELLERKIRGLWPWPGAAANYNSKKSQKSERVVLAMAKTTETTNQAALPPGTLDENLNVTCGKDALKIIKIKPAGGKLLDFKDFVNGRQTQPGDLFAKTDK